MVVYIQSSCLVNTAELHVYHCFMCLGPGIPRDESFLKTCTRSLEGLKDSKTPRRTVGSVFWSVWVAVTKHRKPGSSDSRACVSQFERLEVSRRRDWKRSECQRGCRLVRTLFWPTDPPSSCCVLTWQREGVRSLKDAPIMRGSARRV